MTNRSTFPQQIDSFVEYAELSASDKTNADRYQELLMKTNRTSGEDTELVNLKTILATKIVSSESINKMNDCITNLEGYFLNQVMVDLAALDVGVLRNDIGTPANLLTTDKTSVVAAVNEVQTETDSAHTKIGSLPSLSTAQKTSLVSAVNELDGNFDNHLNNTSNPHLTTASQVGAYSKTETDAEFISGTGERMELCVGFFFTNGGSGSSVANVTFSKAFTTPPTVTPANVPASVPYIDVIRYPYIYNVTTTGFAVKITTGDSSLLGTLGSAANAQINFIAIGK